MWIKHKQNSLTLTKTQHFTIWFINIAILWLNRRSCLWFLCQVCASVSVFCSSTVWVTTSSGVWNERNKAADVPHSGVIVLPPRQYTLSCQSLRLIARAEQKGLSSFSCLVRIKWLLVYVIMSTHRKLHICWWENVSLSWGDETDGFSFVHRAEKSSDTTG